MKFSLSVAALFAIYGQALGEAGLGNFTILQHGGRTLPRTLSLQGETPIFEAYDPEGRTWQISQVGATTDGKSIVNIQSTSTGGYLSCSTTDEEAPCELKQSKYSIQTFIERSYGSGENTRWLFNDQKTGKYLLGNERGYLELTTSPIDGLNEFSLLEDKVNE